MRNPAPSFDRQALLDRVAGDRALLHEIVDLFCADAPPRLDALVRALESGDMKAARESAHALKGGVSIFDAKPAYEAAERIEGLAASGRTEALRSALDQLESEYRRLGRELMEFTVEL